MRPRPPPRTPASAQAALLVLLALTAIVPAPAQAATRTASDPVEVTALAVAQDANGTFVGVHATVTAQVLADGSGQVFVATKPLAQTDMQGSARLASRVAAATLGVPWGEHDYLVSFTSQSTVIGGPSAGAVMTLALTVALHNLRDPEHPWRLDEGVAATGTINPDGTIGPVGGIPAKAEGAKDAGLRVFLYPAGLDVASTQVDGRTLAVDMREHCRRLDLSCRATATLADLLHEAAGVDVRLPDEDVPDTAAYADELAPSVEAQVDELQDRIVAVETDQRTLVLAEEERAEVEAALDLARERLQAAQAALGDQRHYLAATRSFQGAIAAGRAENLTAFFSDESPRGVLAAAVAECTASAQAASDGVDGLRSAGLNDVYAVGAAQQRAALARELAEQATQQARTDRVDEALAALGTAAFCDERADTVAWWAGLREAFGPGPAVGDRDALARDTVDEARDLVAYAVAVLGSAGDATAQLASAEGHLAAGRPDAAVLAAVEAQTAASVAMQTGGADAAVPEAVLAAAQQSAARAVAAARAAGIEPVLAVALVELAQDQEEPAARLANLWSARSLALLDVAQPAALPDGPMQGAEGRTGRDDAVARAGAAVLLAGGLAAIVLAVAALRRR